MSHRPSVYHPDTSIDSHKRNTTLHYGSMWIFFSLCMWAVLLKYKIFFFHWVIEEEGQGEGACGSWSG